MVFRKFLGPSDLLGSQVLGIYELTKIVEVGEDKYFKFASLQKMTQSLEDLNYDQEFLIVSFVLNFY